MTVWAVHPVDNVDVSSAEHFGKIVYLNRRYVFPDETDDRGDMPPAFWRNLYTALAEFRPDTDFLLMAGDHFQIMTLVAILAHEHNFIQALRWDKTANAYIVVRIRATLD